MNKFKYILTLTLIAGWLFWTPIQTHTGRLETPILVQKPQILVVEGVKSHWEAFGHGADDHREKISDDYWALRSDKSYSLSGMSFSVSASPFS